MFRLHLPEKKLEELAKRIKPVVEFGIRTYRYGGKVRHRLVHPDELLFHSDEFVSSFVLFYIKPVNDLKEDWFTWNPKPAEPARDICPKPYKIITTYHTYCSGYYFGASIEEVLAQIPEKDVGRVAAFETQTTASVGFSACQKYHATTTRLFERKV